MPAATPPPIGPAKVKGRDGKMYPATKPKPPPEAGPADAEPDGRQHPAPDLKAQPEGVGIRYAVEAINALKRIPIDDPLLERALSKVMNFIRATSNRRRSRGGQEGHPLDQ